MIEYFQLLAIPLFLIAAILRGTERRIIRRLRSAGATTSDAAVEIPNFNILGRWQLKRLISAGAIVTTISDRYYFVDKGYSIFRNVRRKRAVVMIPIIGIVVALVVILS